MDPLRGKDEERLDALFQAYRLACRGPEASANFMPELWQRIEARQRYTFSFKRMANALVTAAVALSIALGVYMAMPHGNANSYSYVEALADASSVDNPDLVPARLDLSESGR